MTSRNKHILSWVVLSVAILATFFLQDQTAGFPPGHHSYLSTQALAMSKNLSPDHQFFMYTLQEIQEDGRVQFRPHNRFPIGAFAILGAALRPLGDDPVLEVRVARQLMNLFFVGAVISCFLLVARLLGRPILAAAVALVAFSSYYMQYYNDMVFNDIPALFGFVLMLLGIVTWEMDKSKKLLYAAVFVSVFLGWQVYGVLACWWVLDAMRSLWQNRTDPTSGVRKVLGSPATKSFLLAILWGVALLAFNLINESRVMKTEILDLPSTRSIQFRLGLLGGVEEFPEHQELAWRSFLETQSRRLMKAMIPSRPLHASIDNLLSGSGFRTGWKLLFLTVPAFLAMIYFFFRFFREHRHTVAVLVVLLSGFFWILPMRNFSTFHDFQSIFYIGVVLIFYSALFTRLPAKTYPVVAVLALGMYLFSCADLNAEKAKMAAPSEIRTVDFVAINNAVEGRGRKIQAGAEPDELADIYKQLRFYMAGDYFSHEANAEYVLTRRRDYNSRLLTPNNRELFLFEKTATQ